MTAKTNKAPTKEAAFLARTEKFIGMKDGPQRERVRAAIRVGLAICGRGRRLDGGPLNGAFHCMRLAQINLVADDGQPRIAKEPEPEFALAYLASVAADLAEVMNAVAAELDAADARRAA